MSADHPHGSQRGQPPTSRARWVFIAFAVIAAYFLIAEHEAHLYGWLSTYGIWLLLLACPLLHLFMHGAHGGHARPSDRDAVRDPRPDDRQTGWKS